MKLILGVTGGSGCGKSVFCKMLSSFGAKVIDADITARKIVRPGTPALEEITKYFGCEYLLPEGELDRKKLGALVFSDAQKLHVLNQITHKYIIEEIQSELERVSGAAVVDAAVLFESGLSALCTRSACVLADTEIRVRRIMERDGLSRIHAQERIRSQQPDEFYIRRADDVFYNNGTEQELFAVCEKFWEQLER